MLSVHAGPETRMASDGSIVTLDLGRSRLGSFELEHDLRFDLAMWRHASRVAEALRRFSPDVLHLTGPSDVGQLAAYLGHRLSIPMVASWHTNLHEYASRRLKLGWATEARRARTRAWVEQQALRSLVLFYKIPRVILAPNDELLSLLSTGTGKPTFLMSRGVDTDMFSPAKRGRPNTIVNIGYVGRLSAEKNVRVLQAVEATLDSEGLDVRFTLVGEGSERDWLHRKMLRAEFTGVLRDEALARTYAGMDVFLFPSETDTVGNVVLEAMASGVPVVAMARGGPKFMIEPGRSGFLAPDERSMIDCVRILVRDRARRETMAVAARARARDLWSWDRIFDGVCGAYNVAISLARDQRGDIDIAAPRIAATRPSR
jgi:phosphatidylinositol alpha 1,6-mannosyltransferase